MIVETKDSELLTIFYDGHCPLCVAEMNHLARKDNNNAIELVDIHQDGFAQLYPEIKHSDAMKILHGKYQGKTLLGLEVTHRAWTLVGKGFWVAPLNWPVIKTLSHFVYLGLAKYRQPISSFLAKVFGLKANNCNSGICYDNSTNTDNRRK
ncbi:DUF393 domain-containing protein [Psychrosphaera saromensis]|uniref:DUF393 domain-containing protein n=2 Tax=Psychrosphaera saromensis TaxID=716813 RepID=A0A2S7UYY8_9GAMM|nr:DUF393 domain-containing protein [Psychrosphaera saromensis]